jgi:hypothetical protein
MLPSWMVAALQGILPPMMLAIWISLVPIALCILVSFQRLYSHQAVESSVKRFYFIFLFIQVFLVTSLSTSITTVLEGLRSRAKSVPVVLAQNLLKASNYFFSYFIIQASSTISITLICGEKLLNLLLSNIQDCEAEMDKEQVLIHQALGHLCAGIYKPRMYRYAPLVNELCSMLKYRRFRPHLLSDFSPHFTV